MSLILNIRHDSHHRTQVEVQQGWTIGEVRQYLTEHHNLPATECRLIYQGQELLDEAIVENCNFGTQDLVHLVRDPHRRPVNSGGLNQLSALREELVGVGPSVSSGDATTSQWGPSIFVYCKSHCKDVTPGRLRIRCSKCKGEDFQVDNELSSLHDCLQIQNTHGTCNGSDCTGNQAEFYFQCLRHESDGNESSVLLDLVHENRRKVPCITCAGTGSEVLVFPCSSRHTMCLECFHIYCTVKLNDRDFVEHETYGYTLPCPAGCDNSLIQEAHHFRILGNEQYDRYQRFGTEEYILKMGGVLCPRPGCGAGLLPDPGVSRVICMQGCGFVFCRHCKESIHDGDCAAPEPLASGVSAYHVDEDNAERARWEEDSKRLIDATTKRCPGCHVPTERIEGCMHMTCSRCNFEWCWICTVEWNRDCQGQHWFA